jgi:phosphohistidine swiveling domain-containing protein
MALVIQPLVVPTLGGVAHVVDDEIRIVTGAGPSMGMLEGSNSITSPIPDDIADQVEGLLGFANHELGITACEWALVDGEVVLLQIKRAVRRLRETPGAAPDVKHPDARRVAEILRRAPGPLGRHFVLTWALAAEPALIGDVTGLTPSDLGPIRALDRADEIARTLTAEVWQRARPMAWEDAVRVLGDLAGPEPRNALKEVARLRAPDVHRVGEILPMLGRVLLAISGLRHGSPLSESWFLDVRHAVGLLMGDAPSQWTTEPDELEGFDVAVLMEYGAVSQGFPAAPGRRSGRACFVPDATRPDGFRPRDVVLAPTADRDLAPLLWTAAAIVTGKGTPAAHLFEVARARGIPAVCGADLDFFSGDPEAVCVDGSAGTVHSLPW